MKLFSILLPAAIACSMAIPAGAADFASIAVRQKDGSERLFPADGFRLSYAGGSVTLSNFKSAEVAPIAMNLADLESMAFSTTVTSGVKMTAELAEGAFGIFSLDGIYLGCFSSLDEARAQLPSAIYIVKSAEGSKIIIL